MGVSDVDVRYAGFNGFTLALCRGAGKFDPRLLLALPMLELLYRSADDRGGLVGSSRRRGVVSAIISSPFVYGMGMGIVLTLQLLS